MELRGAPGLPHGPQATSVWAPSSFHIWGACFDWEPGGKKRTDRKGPWQALGRSAYRTGSGGAENRGALPTPRPLPVAQSVLNPYPRANHDGDGHGWGSEGCREDLGIEKELVLDLAPNPEWRTCHEKVRARWWSPGLRIRKLRPREARRLAWRSDAFWQSPRESQC